MGWLAALSLSPPADASTDSLEAPFRDAPRSPSRIERPLRFDTVVPVNACS
jgi:hypothetical protein